jgi:hypothetical protein
MGFRILSVSMNLILKNLDKFSKSIPKKILRIILLLTK